MCCLQTSRCSEENNESQLLSGESRLATLPQSELTSTELGQHEKNPISVSCRQQFFFFCVFLS